MEKGEAGTQDPLAHPSLLQDLPSMFDLRPRTKIPGGVQEPTLDCQSQFEVWLSHHVVEFLNI